MGERVVLGSDGANERETFWRDNNLDTLRAAITIDRPQWYDITTTLEGTYVGTIVESLVA